MTYFNRFRWFKMQLKKCLLFDFSFKMCSKIFIPSPRYWSTISILVFNPKFMIFSKSLNGVYTSVLPLRVLKENNFSYTKNHQLQQEYNYILISYYIMQLLFYITYQFMLSIHTCIIVKLLTPIAFLYQLLQIHQVPRKMEVTSLNNYFCV